MEKHEQSHTSANEPWANAQAALKASRGDPELDRRAIERAENEGPRWFPGIGNHPLPNRELRLGRHAGWLDRRTPALTAHVGNNGL